MQLSSSILGVAYTIVYLVGVYNLGVYVCSDLSHSGGMPVSSVTLIKADNLQCYIIIGRAPAACTLEHHM